MNIRRIAAFSNGNTGGNPAGVWIGSFLPEEVEMQQIAANLGFSETVFAASAGGFWRVRYFSPECEVPFCGHATIALGAVLAIENGDGVFNLQLNTANITVEGHHDGTMIRAALQSPPTHSTLADTELVSKALALFTIPAKALNNTIPPAIIHGGANHLVLAINSRDTLRSMTYDLSFGKAFMKANNLTTILLINSQTPRLFHARNAFASGGIYEDPATGAAAAAFAGYLNDISWPHEGSIDIVQGEDMGMRSLLHAEIPSLPSSSIRVSGSVRIMDPGEKPFLV